MKKFVPRRKLSKKEKRKLDLTKRATWKGIVPVTKILESKKRYDRKNQNINKTDVAQTERED